MRGRLWLPVLGGLLLSGCSRGPIYEPRRFPTVEQALAHWHSHEREFRQVVVAWRESGGQEFTPYTDSWWWNSSHARKTWWGGWRVNSIVATPPETIATVDKDFSSLEEVARFCRSSRRTIGATYQPCSEPASPIARRSGNPSRPPVHSARSPRRLDGAAERVSVLRWYRRGTPRGVGAWIVAVPGLGTGTCERIQDHRQRLGLLCVAAWPPRRQRLASSTVRFPPPR
jgi:hypothetical protein